MPKVAKEGQPLLTADIKAYNKNYQQIYYRKNIEQQRKKQREYYHRTKHKKKMMNLPPHRRGCKLDMKVSGILTKINHKFIITFD